MNENLDTAINSKTDNQQTSDEMKGVLCTVDQYRKFADTNPMYLATNNGVILVQISEQEWLDTAYAAKKPNASMMHKFGMMTGWKGTVNGEQIYKKMSQATEYTLP